MFTGGRGVDREKGTAWLDCKNGEATAVQMRRARCSMYSKVLRLGLARVGEFGGGRPDQTQTGVAQKARGFNKTSSGDARYMRCGGMRVYDQVPAVKQTSRGFKKRAPMDPLPPGVRSLSITLQRLNTLKMESE